MSVTTDAGRYGIMPHTAYEWACIATHDYYKIYDMGTSHVRKLYAFMKDRGFYTATIYIGKIPTTVFFHDLVSIQHVVQEVFGDVVWDANVKHLIEDGIWNEG